MHIVVISYLIMVSRVQSKKLTIGVNFHEGLTIPTFVVALCIDPLHIIKSNIRCHNLYHIVRIF